MKKPSLNIYKKRRSIAVFIIMSLVILLSGFPGLFGTDNLTQEDKSSQVLSEQAKNSPLAKEILKTISVKGRSPKTGYSRSQFGEGWGDINGCDTRNIVLSLQLKKVKLAEDGCIVLSGILNDPYTGRTINFLRGSTTSSKVQIDHVVALSDAWQKGAQFLKFEDRVALANDILNLLAVDGPANRQKGDSDAASWLPANKSYRCRYVARQIAVKSKYSLWVTPAEKLTMVRILNGCGDQVVPVQE